MGGVPKKDNAMKPICVLPVSSTSGSELFRFGADGDLVDKVFDFVWSLRWWRGFPQGQPRTCINPMQFASEDRFKKRRRCASGQTEIGGITLHTKRHQPAPATFNMFALRAMSINSRQRGFLSRSRRLYQQIKPYLLLGAILHFISFSKWRQRSPSGERYR